MRAIIALSIAIACLGQGKRDVIPLGTVEGCGAKRAGAIRYELTGAQIPPMLSGGQTGVQTAPPIPRQLTGAYSIMVNFAVTSGTAAAAATLTGEVCNYAAC